MSMPNTSRLDSSGENRASRPQPAPGIRPMARLGGRPDVAFHRVGPIQWGMEFTKVGLSRSSTDAGGCRLGAAALASKRAR